MKNKRGFYTANLFAEKRVGPHNQDVISVLVGNLLGDGYAEKRKNSTRFHLHLSNKNAQYVFWLHKFFADRGYCTPARPSVKKQIGKKNKVYFSINFNTFSFKSLNWLHDLFYPSHSPGKRVPAHVKELLTERALSVWVMKNGGKSENGLKISTEGFSLQDNKVLQKALSERFFVEPTIQRYKGKYLLYVKKKDISCLSQDLLNRRHIPYVL